jgi:hypothetical protein
MLISRLFHVRDGLTSATDSTLELQFIVSLCFRRSPQGAPALPHLQPCSPSQGVSGSFSHTQPQSVYTDLRATRTSPERTPRIDSQQRIFPMHHLSASSGASSFLMLSIKNFEPLSVR